MATKPTPPGPLAYLAHPVNSGAVRAGRPEPTPVVEGLAGVGSISKRIGRFGASPRTPNPKAVATAKADKKRAAAKGRAS